MPTALNYDATNLLVNTLDAAKGDALFIEGIGYQGVPDARLGAMLDPEWFKTEVGLLRDMQDIDTFNYVASLVAVRGVRVEYADVHGDVYQDFLAKEGLTEDSKLTHDQDTAKDQLRNEQAVYTIKDDALAHLEEAKASGIKPTYIQLMGDGHVNDYFKFNDAQLLPEIYESLGLKVNVLHIVQAAGAIKVIEAMGTITNYLLNNIEEK